VTWGAFVAAYTIVRFALNGEWAVGSMLVAETWPARRRGLVLSFDRSAWRIWRRARRHDRDLRGDRVGLAGSFRPAGMIALLAIYVRLLSPELPYWVRTENRKRRIAAIG
jgi:MFS transporter, putative metabolite:H+ symporter